MGSEMCIRDRDIILSGTYGERLRCFEVAEDVWIEGKKLLTTGERSVECLGGGPIAELVRRLGLTCNDGSSVVIVDEYSTVNDYEEKLLNRKHIVNALGLSDTVVSEITGRLNYFWSTHPLLYGLPNNLEIKVKLVTLSQFRKVSLIGRPLLFIEEEPLIIELTHNNSVVFLGFNDYLMELVLRAILYVL